MSHSLHLSLLQLLYETFQVPIKGQFNCTLFEWIIQTILSRLILLSNPSQLWMFIPSEKSNTCCREFCLNNKLSLVECVLFVCLFVFAWVRFQVHAIFCLIGYCATCTLTTSELTTKHPCQVIVIYGCISSFSTWKLPYSGTRHWWLLHVERTQFQLNQKEITGDTILICSLDVTVHFALHTN